MAEIYVQQNTCIKCLVVIAFQMYFLLGNASIFFKKIIFNISASKWSENTKKNWSKEKNKNFSNFEKSTFETQK